MITLLLGAGASVDAGYPVQSKVIPFWQGMISDSNRVETAYSLLGFNREEIGTLRLTLHSGLQILQDSGCSTPDQFATRYPAETAKLLTLKEALRALFFIYDQECTGPKLETYQTLWANVLSRQFARGPDRSVESIFSQTPYRIITYNYDTSILIALISFLGQQFNLTDFSYLPRDLQAYASSDDLKDGTQIFSAKRFSCLHVHGSFAFDVDVSGIMEGGQLILDPRFLKGGKVDRSKSHPCIHFPSEVPMIMEHDELKKPDAYVERYVNRVRRNLQQVASVTKVLVVIGFSFHMENWPFLLNFFRNTPRGRDDDRFNTIALVCPFEDLPQIEARAQMLLGEAGRPDVRTIHVAPTFRGYLGLK